MAKLGWLLSLSVLLCGCGDARYASLAEGVRQTRALVLSEPMAKIAATLKGRASEQRVTALYSLEGCKLWPVREKAEFSFLPPNPEVWPSRILLLDRPDSPWSVVVRAKGPRQLEISAYAIEIDRAATVETVDL